MNSVCFVLLRGLIFQFIFNYVIFCLKRIHDNANVIYASMFSDYIFLKTGFIFENHINHNPYTISTNYFPNLATSTIFVKV